MRIVNRTRCTLLGTSVEVADSWWSRFRGYMGRRSPRPGEGILLLPCNAVHTFGMRFDVDVIFLDAHGDVLHLVTEMKPRRLSSRVRGGRYVLEVPAGTIQRTGTAVGDSFTWIPQTSPSLEPAEFA